MNIKMLKMKIAEKNKSIAEIANFIGISASTFYRRLQNNEDFTVGEVEKIGRFLEMNGNEITQIFLTLESHISDNNQ